MTEEKKTYYIFEGDDIVTYFLRVKEGAVDDQGNKHDAGCKLSPKGPTVRKNAEGVLEELRAKAAAGHLRIKWYDCEVISKEEYDVEFPEVVVELDDTEGPEPEIHVKKPGENKRRLF